MEHLLEVRCSNGIGTAGERTLVQLSHVDGECAGSRTIVHLETNLVYVTIDANLAGMIDELGERIVVEGVGRDIRTRLYPRPYKHIVMCLCLCRHWH